MAEKCGNSLENKMFVPALKSPFFCLFVRSFLLLIVQVYNSMIFSSECLQSFFLVFSSHPPRDDLFN
jgi:hypothetical protein